MFHVSTINNFWIKTNKKLKSFYEKSLFHKWISNFVKFKKIQNSKYLLIIQKILATALFLVLLPILYACISSVKFYALEAANIENNQIIIVTYYWIQTTYY
jgi:hypothetical protein